MKGNWLLLELDNDWKMVFPNEDIKPHAKFVLHNIDGSKEAMVDEFECPYKPTVDFNDKLVIHNAFDGRE